MGLSMTNDAYHDPMTSPERYAQYEYQIAVDCIIPLLVHWGIRLDALRVLDVGCGGGGLSIALAQQGAQCLGIDLKTELISEAERVAASHQVEVEFAVADVLNWKHRGRQYDLIILSEVLEHLVSLNNVEPVIASCRDLLAAGGSIYVSFPPWYSPFAGHQAGWPQIRFVPWYHLLPNRLQRLLAPGQALRYLTFARELNHLTIQVFEQTLARLRLTIRRRELYHIRPEFRWRYRLPVVKSSPLLTRLPMTAEVTTSGAYYLLANEPSTSQNRDS